MPTQNTKLKNHVDKNTDNQGMGNQVQQPSFNPLTPIPTMIASNETSMGPTIFIPLKIQKQETKNSIQIEKSSSMVSIPHANSFWDEQMFKIVQPTNHAKVPLH